MRRTFLALVTLNRKAVLDPIPLLLRGLLFGSSSSVTSDAGEKVPTGRRADSL
jgi:hypothetical protein